MKKITKTNAHPDLICSDATEETQEIVFFKKELADALLDLLKYERFFMNKDDHRKIKLIQMFSHYSDDIIYIHDKVASFMGKLEVKPILALISMIYFCMSACDGLMEILPMMSESYIDSLGAVNGQDILKIKHHLDISLKKLASINKKP